MGQQCNTHGSMYFMRWTFRKYYRSLSVDASGSYCVLGLPLLSDRPSGFRVFRECRYAPVPPFQFPLPTSPITQVVETQSGVSKRRFGTAQGTRSLPDVCGGFIPKSSLTNATATTSAIPPQIHMPSGTGVNAHQSREIYKTQSEVA